jgi:hypothetical protein
MIATAVVLVTSLVLGFWQSSTPLPVVSTPITTPGAVFTTWPDEEDTESAECNWWNGTHYFDTSMCNSFAVTRTSAADIAKAIDRASRCAARATTECVLNGEIGFAVPAAFIYDEREVGLRMLIAPRFVDLEPGTESVAKTVKLVDPTGDNPNQLFEFNTTVRVEYLKGGSRSLETSTLTGQDAYCLQVLRRSIVPTCWAGLD